MKITTERVTVTPEMAREMLDGKHENRELSPQAVIKMREALLENLLVGKQLRVYSEDFALLTQDFVPGRVNIEVDRNDTVKRVWFG